MHDESDISKVAARLTAEVNQIACEKTQGIQKITNQMKMLALNALIESARAGKQGAGFAVVAQEVRNVGQQVETIARELETQLTRRTRTLMSSIEQMTERSKGERMVDLALNAIELIDRNLYERTCDVRWWATDSAVVQCAAERTDAASAYASERLAVILGAYTVYLDLWLCDLDGNILASGRPDKFPVAGQNVASAKLVSRRARSCEPATTMSPAMSSSSRCSATPRSAPIAPASAPRAAPTASRSACWRSISTGRPQARAIVQGVRVGSEDNARALLVDSKFRVIAASDDVGILSERIPLSLEGRSAGFYTDRSGQQIAFHATPGYETYKGLGWYGVIVGQAVARGGVSGVGLAVRLW